MARLVGSVAALTAAGPPPAQTLSASECGAVLTARDVLVAELRSLSGALLRLGPDSVRGELGLIAASPAHALHLALVGLPPAAGADRMSLIDALAADGGPLTRAWQDAARAAVTLEAYHHALTEKPSAADAWVAVRDLAEVAAALPHLDADLAAALPAGTDAARAGLLEPVAHGLVRLAAEQLRGQTADLPSRVVSIVRPQAARVRPVRTVGQLPTATRHLAALVAGRGAQLTVLEARAVARVLAEGFDLTARVLTAAPSREPTGRAAAGHLSGALFSLQQVLHGQLATLTSPAPAVLFLAQQIRERLTVVTALVDQLQSEASPRPAVEGLRRVAATMSRWSLEAIGAATDLRDGLHAAVTSGQLLMPRQDPPRGADRGYLWVSVPPTTADSQPVLAASSHAVAALSVAREPLIQVAGALRGIDQAATAPGGAVLPAAAAREQLRLALDRRTPGELSRPTRPGHPANLPDIGDMHLRLGS